MDLATLSFSIDSSQAVQAKDNLDKMKGSSVDATEQAIRLTRAFLDGKDPLATYRAELALMDSSLRNTGAGIDALVDRVRLMGAAMSGALGPTREFSQAMGQMQAAAAMFDTSTKSLEMFVRTTRELGVSSQEMVSGLQRIQAALQGVGEEGRRAREVLRNYGVNLDGRGPNDSASVYREFVDRARGYRMDAGTYNDYQAVVGNVSIQGFAGLRDPEFRTAAQRQREIDATAQVARVADIRESTFAIGRGTNRFQNELGDLETEYGGTARDSTYNIATFGLGGLFQSPAARRAELERRRDAGVVSNTNYYRNRAEPGQGFSSNYLDDLARPRSESFFGAPVGRGVSDVMGFAERVRLGNDWRSSGEYAENSQNIDATYRDRVAREGRLTSLPFVGSASRERASNQMLNGMRQFEAPPINISQQENDRLPAYLNTTAAMGAMRMEGGDPLAQQRRRLVMDALQRFQINVPDAEMLPLSTLETRLGSARGGVRNIQAIDARSGVLDQSNVDRMLEIEPYTFGVNTPFAGRRRERDLARFGTVGDGEGASTGGWQNATSEAEANRADRVAQIMVDAQRKYKEETERTRAVKERVLELDQQTADAVSRASAAQERQTKLTESMSSLISNAVASGVPPEVLGVMVRREGAVAAAANSALPNTPENVLFGQYQQELSRLNPGRMQRIGAIERADEMLNMRESGLGGYEVAQQMEVNDQVRGLEVIAKALDQQSTKRQEILNKVRELRVELEIIQRTEQQQQISGLIVQNQNSSSINLDNTARARNMRGMPDQYARENQILQTGRRQYGQPIADMSDDAAIAWLQRQRNQQGESYWDSLELDFITDQMRSNGQSRPLMEAQINLASAGRSVRPLEARDQQRAAQRRLIDQQYAGNQNQSDRIALYYDELNQTQDFQSRENPIESANIGGNQARSSRGYMENRRGSESDDLYVAAMMILENGPTQRGRMSVGNVINNRMRIAGSSGYDIISTPGQFEPWATRQTELRDLLANPNSPRMQASLADWRRIRGGEVEDMTGGATHFLNENTVRARTGTLPNWTRTNNRLGEIEGQAFYDGNFRRPGGATVAGAQVNSELDTLLEQYRRTASTDPAAAERYLSAETMRRVEEGLNRIATASRAAGENLDRMAEQVGMTPYQQRENQAINANPDIQRLEGILGRLPPGSAAAQSLEGELDTARQNLRGDVRRRAQIEFQGEQRGLNYQEQDAEFQADGWWMSGARRQRELAQSRTERDMRDRLGMDPNNPADSAEWQQRIDQVGRIAEYSEIARQNQLIRDSFLQVGNAAGSALDQIILKGGNARQVMAALLASMASSAVRLGTNKLFEFGMDALGAGIRGATAPSGGAAGGGSSGGGFWDFIGTLVRAGASASAPVPAAQGHAFGPSGIVPMAQGGSLIRSPTYFPMANGGTALGGEAGPEAILPLGRDSSGRLGVIGGGGATNNFNVTVNMQGSSGNAAQDAKAAAMMGKMVRAEMEKMMTENTKKQMQPGGMLAGGGAPVYG